MVTSTGRFFSWLNMEDEQQLDITQLRYVLYVRKSTDDPKRQLRSIPDQISECMELAHRLHLRVVSKIIRETKSAKKPNLRLKFTQMLEDIRQGKYDAILAWNPDRLARNMKEGGEIIDMIDEGLIKDLKFVTHTFSNDANGKMLLGMAFVLSKQYSDKLSQDVTRGVKRNFWEGKMPAPKYGYLRDDEGLYRPDGNNYKLICKAWEMRGEETSIEDITDYLNKHGFTRVIKTTGEKTKMTKQKLSKMFQNPFYYGLLIQVNRKTDLRELYDFIPATDEANYNKVQSLSYRRMKPSKPHKNHFYPFRLMIYCHYCSASMRVAPSTGNTNRYLYARCDNEACVRNSEKNKKLPKGHPDKIKISVRTKVILDFVYGFLRGGLKLTEEDYNNYYSAISEITGARREELMIELHSRIGRIKQIKREIKDNALALTKLANQQSKVAWKAINNRINELDTEAEEIKKVVKKIKKKLEDPEKEKLTTEQFLNLSKNAEVIVKYGNAKVKDTICRLIFANFFIDDEKVTKYRLNEPFATLLNRGKFPSSRGRRN